MKAALVAIFLLAVATYAMGRLTEKQCRTPVPLTSCADNAKIRTVYSFISHTNQCEPVEGSCGEGVNQFEKIECCMSECPYGAHSKTSKRSNENV
uniref:Putative tick kunitz 54 n=1 Tax=Ixodes ricinus TaxID=34613 RepID=V5HXL6_IXORI